MLFGTAPSLQRAVAGLGLLWLAGWWLAGYRRARFAPPGDVLEGLALLLIGVVADPAQAVGLWYAGLLYRALYASLQRTGILTGIYLAALLGAGLLASPLGELTPQYGLPLAGFAVTAGPLALLTATLARYERAASRERVMAATSAALVAAPDREAIYTALLEAGMSLLPGRSDVRVSVWIGNPERMTAAAVAGDRAEALRGAHFNAAAYLRRHPLPSLLLPTPTDADIAEIRSAVNAEVKTGAIAFAPLVWDGELRGAVAVGANRPLPPSLPEALTMLATEASLALERASVTDTLQQSEARFRSLVQHSSDMTLIVGADASIDYVSPAVQQVLGYPPAALTGTNLRVWLRPEEAAQVDQTLRAAMDQPGVVTTVEWEFRDAAGGWRICETNVTSLAHDPSVQGVVLTARDIGERKALRDDLAYQASHDPLTGLVNRTLFRERVDHALARLRRRHQPLAVLFLDLDNFERINDTLGHAAGDQALISVADRLRRRLRATDTAARFGGDEFALLLEDLRSPADAARLADW
ncbi:MAG: diguanylate cyclase, partial [Chloroflexi bacterium]|nr:diguanylate cyclase [Chloroflexota bacterium]